MIKWIMKKVIKYLRYSPEFNEYIKSCNDNQIKIFKEEIKNEIISTIAYGLQQGDLKYDVVSSKCFSEGKIISTTYNTYDFKDQIINGLLRRYSDDMFRNDLIKYLNSSTAIDLIVESINKKQIKKD